MGTLIGQTCKFQVVTLHFVTAAIDFTQEPRDASGIHYLVIIIFNLKVVQCDKGLF